MKKGLLQNNLNIRPLEKISIEEGKCSIDHDASRTSKKKVHSIRTPVDAASRRRSRGAEVNLVALDGLREGSSSRLSRNGFLQELALGRARGSGRYGSFH